MDVTLPFNSQKRNQVHKKKSPPTKPKKTIMKLHFALVIIAATSLLNHSVQAKNLGHVQNYEAARSLQTGDQKRLRDGSGNGGQQQNRDGSGCMDNEDCECDGDGCTGEGRYQGDCDGDCSGEGSQERKRDGSGCDGDDCTDCNCGDDCDGEGPGPDDRDLGWLHKQLKRLRFRTDSDSAGQQEQTPCDDSDCPNGGDCSGNQDRNQDGSLCDGDEDCSGEGIQQRQQDGSGRSLQNGEKKRLQDGSGCDGEDCDCDGDGANCEGQRQQERDCDGDCDCDGDGNCSGEGQQQNQEGDCDGDCSEEGDQQRKRDGSGTGKKGRGKGVRGGK